MNEEPLRVLLVDDDSNLREPLAEFLHDHHRYHVDAAASAEQAWELVLAAEQPYHVALIDDLLSPGGGRRPIRSGIELMGRIKAHSPCTEVIIFTGWGMERALEAMRAGAFLYLPKPFNLDKLGALIRRAAEHRHPDRDLHTPELLDAFSEKMARRDIEVNKLLQEIITLATISLGADEGTLLLIGENGELNYWQNYGRYSLSGKNAQILKEGGCLGWVIRNGQPVRLDDFRADPRWHVFPDDLLQQGSALLAPLKQGGKTIGVISLTNSRTGYFNEEHLRDLEAIASQAVQYISRDMLIREALELTGQVIEQREKLDRVVTCSPNGIIGIDTQGMINLFNERSQKILGYTEEEALGQWVSGFYASEDEARRIGKLLESAPKHTIRSEKAELKSKDGRLISVLLSATYWYGARREWIGSIGYFEDITEIQRKKDQVALLSKASEVVARAESITEGLDALAEHLINHLNRTFCSVLLLDESSASLIVKAAHYRPDARARLSGRMQLENQVSLPVCPVLSDLFKENQPRVISLTDAGLRSDLEDFSRQLHLAQPIRSLLMVPLKRGAKSVGVLTLGEVRDEAVYPFTPDDINLARAVAHQITGLIDRLWQHETVAILLQQTQEAHARQRALSQASDKLVALKEPEQLLQNIVELTCEATGAKASRLILIDEMNQPRRVIPGGAGGVIDPLILRPDGVSLTVLREGKAIAIPDIERDSERLSADLRQVGAKSTVCLPFFAQGVKHGVLWADYDQPRNFPPHELEALQLYVNQAASAYDNARRMEELRHMRDAAEVLATPAELPVTLRRIAELAREVLQADSAVIYSMDGARSEYNLRNSVEVGINNDEVWTKLQQLAPRLAPTEGGIVATVLENKLIGVGDISDQASYPFIGKETRKLLGQIGVRSFQGIALAVGDEEFGVLYVNYNRQRSFSDEEQDTARTFANHAALALRRVRMLKQVTDARNTANAVAKVTTLGDLDTTLKMVAQGARDVTGCEPIMLFVYDQQRKSFRLTPTMIGAEYEDMASRHPVPKDSIVYEIMNQGRTVKVGDVSVHPLFKDRDFAKRERIKSCFAVPLKIGDESVGVLFVNDRSPHKFTENEQRNIELFANQAAVAIGNARLYQQVQKQVAALQTLHESGNEITGSLDEREVAHKIIRQVWKLASKENSFATLREIVNGEAVLVDCHPAAPVNDCPIILDPGAGERMGITGRAVLTKQAQLVGDVTRDPDYIKYHPFTSTELTVPVIIDEKVDYVINLEHPDFHAFDEEDKQVLKALAAQTAIALQNARKHESLKQANDLVKKKNDLLWVTLVSGIWEHDIRGHAITIKDEAQEILDDSQSADLTGEQRVRIEKIGRLARKILAYRITPPLPSDNGIPCVSINDFLTESLRAWRENEAHQGVTFNLDLPQDETLPVRITLEWLREACDQLVDNSVKAMTNSPRRELSIATYRKNGSVEIAFTDTGPGIPEKLKDKILVTLIPKEEGGKGTGAGLLVADTIVHNFGGKIRIGETGASGTTMVIQLPLES